MLHCWRASGSTAGERLPCTHPLTSSTRLGMRQVPFFMSSLCLARPKIGIKICLNECEEILTHVSICCFSTITHFGYIQVRRRRGTWWGHWPNAFGKGGNGAEVHFHNRIVVSFTVYQDRHETYLQLFTNTENSERFSIISAIVSEVNIVDEEKQS